MSKRVGIFVLKLHSPLFDTVLRVDKALQLDIVSVISIVGEAKSRGRRSDPSAHVGNSSHQYPSLGQEFRFATNVVVDLAIVAHLLCHHQAVGFLDQPSEPEHISGRQLDVAANLVAK